MLSTGETDRTMPGNGRRTSIVGGWPGRGTSGPRLPRYSLAINLALRANGSASSICSGRRFPSGGIRISVGTHGLSTVSLAGGSRTPVARFGRGQPGKHLLRALFGQFPYPTFCQPTRRDGSGLCEATMSRRDGGAVPADLG